jgi:uridine phosphorylase
MPFPLRPRKHSQPAIFRADHFLAYRDKLGERSDPSPATVVLAFSPRAVDRGVERWGARPVRGHPRLFAIGRGARTVGLAEPRGIGGPSLSVTVEELAATGTRRFVVVGYAGAVRPELRAGSYVLCTRALRDEGTSYHYVRPSRWAHPSPRLTRAVADGLTANGVPFRRGPTWTIDAPYRETVEELRAVRRAGALTVEMEASALFSIARVRTLEAAAVFAISDLLEERGWTPRFREAHASLERLLDVVIGSLAGGTTPRSAPRRRGRTSPGGKPQ